MTDFLIVAGSRDLTYEAHYLTVADAIDSWIVQHAKADVTIVEGGAKGADVIAAHYCAARSVPHRAVFADWKRHGKAAGPIRNEEMAQIGTGLVVVRYPDSRGSLDMLRRMQRKGAPIVDVVLTRPAEVVRG